LKAKNSQNVDFSVQVVDGEVKIIFRRGTWRTLTLALSRKGRSSYHSKAGQLLRGWIPRFDCRRLRDGFSETARAVADIGLAFEESSPAHAQKNIRGFGADRKHIQTTPMGGVS
jgi:hypothetical protein